MNFQAVLDDALHGDRAARDAAYDTIVSVTAPTVMAVMQQVGGQRNGEEMTQAFFVEQVVAKDLISRLDRTGPPEDLKPSLQRFFAHCAREFGASWLRSENARKRREGSQRIDRRAPVDRALEEWATGVLREAHRRAESHYLEKGKQHYWAAYRARVLAPAAHNTKPPPFGAIYAELGFDDSRVTASSIQTVCRFISAAVYEMLEDEASVTGEDLDALVTLLRRVLHR